MGELRDKLEKYGNKTLFVISISVLWGILVQLFQLFPRLGFSFIPFFSWTQCINDGASIMVCLLIAFTISSTWYYFGTIYLKFVERKVDRWMLKIINYIKKIFKINKLMILFPKGFYDEKYLVIFCSILVSMLIVGIPILIAQRFPGRLMVLIFAVLMWFYFSIIPYTFKYSQEITKTTKRREKKLEIFSERTEKFATIGSVLLSFVVISLIILNNSSGEYRKIVIEIWANRVENVYYMNDVYIFTDNGIYDREGNVYTIEPDKSMEEIETVLSEETYDYSNDICKW